MTTLSIAITDATCGEACWMAREDVCRCSCGGKNHAVLRDGRDRPERMSKIQGHAYKLTSVGEYRDIYRLAADALDGVPGKPPMFPSHYGPDFTYRWNPSSDKGSPVRIRTASQSEIARWPELTAYRDLPPFMSGPYLLWTLA